MASTTSPKEPRKGIPVAAGIGAIVVLIVIAGIGWGLYAMKPAASPAKTALTTTEQEQIVTSLAYEHWNAIGMENLKATMSQYAPNATLYWYMENTPFDTAYNAGLNGTYSTSTTINNTWTKFFHESVVYYWVGALSVTVTGKTATAQAKLWYIVSNGTVNQSASVNSQLFTLIVPYLLTYYNTSTGWVLVSDWWGLPASQGTVVQGAYGLQAYLAAKLPFPK